MKTCLRCNTPKEESLFGKETRRSDGLRPYCKECCKTMTAEYRKSEGYRENERKYARDYNNEHKEERREYRLEYETRPENKERLKETSRYWWKNNQEKWFYYSSKYRAKKKNIPFDLEPSDIVIPESCPILGLPLSKGIGCVTDASPSIDQIVPNAGYVKGNIQIISHRANTLKSNGTIREFKKLIEYLELQEQGKNQCDSSPVLDTN